MGKMDPVGALFRNAWGRFTARFWTLVWIFVPPAVIVSAEQIFLIRGTPGATAVGATLSLIGALVSIVASIALVNALARGTGFGNSWRVGFRLFLPAIWITILAMVAVLGGVVLLIVPGIVMAVSLMFTTYALVVEDARGVAALRRSRLYVHGRWWAVIGRMFLVILIYLVAAAVIYGPALILGGRVTGGVAYFVIVTLFTPFSVSYSFEMYENLRRLAAAPAASTPGGAVATGAAGTVGVAGAGATGAGTGAASVAGAAPAKRDFLEVCFVIGAIAAIVIAILIAGTVFGRAW